MEVAPMRPITDVLREKEARVEQLKDEIEKLKTAARILEQAEGLPGPPATEMPRPVMINKNWP
jgi:hypothetical protein